MKKRFFAVLLCLCLLVGLVPNMGTTAYAAWLAIGETVNFAGHEWYIIGTDEEADGGVTAPDGCYTLLAKNNEFGSITFRANANRGDSTAYYYKDSDLQKKMEEIANGFSEEERSNIQPRTLTVANDDIKGAENDTVENQYLWPLSCTVNYTPLGSYIDGGEMNEVPEALRAFDATYWTRTGLDGWDDGTGGQGQRYYYDIIGMNQDGTQNVVGNSAGLFVNRYATLVTGTLAIRPALYVKQEAVTPLPSFYLNADTISNASVGGNLVANSGNDASLTRSENQDVDVRAYSDGGTTQYGTSLLFNYLSATRGENQVVACVLTDEDGNVAYYGKLADRSNSAPDVDDVSVPLEGVAAGIYTLSIFSHNTATGEISEPSPTMTVTVVGSIGFVSNYEGDTSTEIVIPPNPGPTFTQHPQDQIIEENGAATFTAEADGTDIAYYWQAQPKSSDPDTGTWYNIYTYVVGGVSTQYSGQSLSLSNVSGTWQENGYTLDGGSGFDPAGARFRCRAYDPYAYSDSYSNPAELTVISGGGTDGREVELRTNDTHIQWRYAGEGDDAWRDLVALSAITGEAGADGREIQLQVANGYIQWKYDTDTQWNDLLDLSDLQGQDGDDGREIELRNNGVTIQWRYVGEADTEWKDLVDLSAITGSDGQDGAGGADGREVELRVDGGYIQWKYNTDPDTQWQNLIAVSALQGMKGDKGDKGDPGEDGQDGADGETPYIGGNGNWWIGGVDTGIKATGSNGSDGEDGKDGQDGKDGADGETPYIGSNGNWWIGSTDTGIKAAGTNGTNGAGIADVSINDSGELIVTLTDGTELNAGAVPTGEAGNSGLQTIVYVSLGMAGVSLAGLIAVLAFLFSKRKMLTGK